MIIKLDRISGISFAKIGDTVPLYVQTVRAITYSKKPLSIG